MRYLIIALYSIVPYMVLAQDGIVKGKVVDATTNEALPFVNVVVTGTTTGTTTDEYGLFAFKGLQPGFITLTVSFIGYQTAISRDIMVSKSAPVYLEVELQSQSKELEEVVVKTKLNRKTEESPVSLNSFGIREIETSPGSNRDISKVIQSYPGVGSTPSFRNDVIIRGGGPSESRFFLDGVEIPNLNHFSTQGSSGGAVGILNADLIGSVNFYSGAFPASKGNALSGIFEFTQIDGNRDRQKFKASLGASELSFTADGPVGSKSSYIASFRRSYLQFLFSALGLPFLPTFNDYQVKYRTRFNTKNEFTLVSIGALDQNRLNTSHKDPTPEQSYRLGYLPESDQWSYTIGGVYKHYGERSNHTLVVSRNMLDNSSYKYESNDDTKAKILDYTSQEIENKLRYEITTRVENYKFTYGISSELARYTNETHQKLTTKGNVYQVDYNSTLDIIKYGIFGQVSGKYLRERLTLSLGARVDATDYDESMRNPLNQISPRFSASYQLTEKLSLNANTGRYYQLPAYTALGYRTTDGTLQNKLNKLTYIESTHFIDGIELRITDNIVFTAEAFLKLYKNYPFSVTDSISIASKGADFGVIGDEALTSTGKGKSYGVEFMNRTRARWFNATLAYTIVRSEFLNKYGNYVPTSWDSRHILTLTVTAQFKKYWSAGLKWRYVGGLPYTPYNLEYSSRTQVWDASGKPVQDLDRLNSERFNPFHQLDLRVDKRFYWQKLSFMVYIDVQNIYNFKAESQDIVLPLQDESGNNILADDGMHYTMQSLSNTTGTILPTIGLMVEF